MAEAYVLITCEEGHEEKIINELSEINDILTTNRVRGPYSNRDNYIRNQDN